MVNNSNLTKCDNSNPNIKVMIELKTITAVISAQLTTELVEELKGSTMYTRNVKYTGNKFLNTLKPFTKEYDIINKRDEELTNNVAIELEKLINKLATCDIRQLTMINQIHDTYKNNQKDWNDLFDIELTKLNS